MARIIAGNFATLEAARIAQPAITALVGEDRVGMFHLNPAGQHDQYAIGGDEFADPGAQDAGSAAVGGAATGAVVGAVAGAVAMPILGPISIAAGAAAGAYAGSFVGGVQGMEHDSSKEQGETPIRPAGEMLTVRTDGTEHEAAVIATMRDAGARIIEEAEGTWINRDWTDFDPVSRPRVLFLQRQP